MDPFIVFEIFWYVPVLEAIVVPILEAIVVPKTIEMIFSITKSLIWPSYHLQEEYCWA